MGLQREEHSTNIFAFKKPKIEPESDETPTSSNY